jgi:hypothetical protein
MSLFFIIKNKLMMPITLIKPVDELMPLNRSSNHTRLAGMAN